LVALSWCKIISQNVDEITSEELFNLLVKAEVLAYSMVCRYKPKNSYNGLFDAADYMLVTPKVS